MWYIEMIGWRKEESGKYPLVGKYTKVFLSKAIYRWK